MNQHKVTLFFLILFLFPLTSFAIELSPEYDPALFKGRSKHIIPDKSVYGVPFGSSAKDLITAFGNPNGIIIISDSKKALLYGRSHLFILKKNKFQEIIVEHHILDWELSKQMEDHPFFESERWVIDPGLKNDMEFDQVRKLLGKPNLKRGYSASIEGEASVTKLKFTSSRVNSGPATYKLRGFIIKNFGR